MAYRRRRSCRRRTRGFGPQGGMGQGMGQRPPPPPGGGMGQRRTGGPPRRPPPRRRTGGPPRRPGPPGPRGRTGGFNLRGFLRDSFSHLRNAGRGIASAFRSNRTSGMYRRRRRRAPRRTGGSFNMAYQRSLSG